MPRFGLSDTKFILPSAQSIPITINGGGKMPGWSVSLLFILTCSYTYRTLIAVIYIISTGHHRVGFRQQRGQSGLRLISNTCE